MTIEDLVNFEEEIEKKAHSTGERTTRASTLMDVPNVEIMDQMDDFDSSISHRSKQYA